jgi:histone H3/H4
MLSTEDEQKRSPAVGDGYTSMADLIVKAAVRDAVDELNVAADFYDELDDKVQALLDDAERRADANGRKTVQTRDL